MNISKLYGNKLGKQCAVATLSSHNRSQKFSITVIKEPATARARFSAEIC